MASSGVRENVYLIITPTFVGVCGMLFLIILVGNFCQMLACMPYVVYILFLNIFWPTFLDVIPTKIIKNNIQHTRTKVGVMVR